MSALVHVQDFDHYMQLTESETRLVMVEFGATWCGPCRQLNPLLDQLSLDYKDQLLVLKVDIDEDRDNNDEDHQLAVLFDVKSVPTVIFLKQRQSQDQHRLTGYNPMGLKESLKALLS